jgi:hypothetical protein
MRIEIFNEFCTISVGYGLLLLSIETNGFMWEAAGIWIVAVIATHFGVNLIIQLIGFVCSIKANWRQLSQKVRGFCEKLKIK